MVNKKENGVSLLALVVTIIVLIIIAGAVIANIRGNSGIINQSANADKKKLTSEEKEAVQWAAAQAVADETNKSGVIADKTKIQEKLNTYIGDADSKKFEYNIYGPGDTYINKILTADIYVVKFQNTGNAYIIDETGNVRLDEDSSGIVDRDGVLINPGSISINREPTGKYYELKITSNTKDYKVTCSDESVLDVKKDKNGKILVENNKIFVRGKELGKATILVETSKEKRAMSYVTVHQEPTSIELTASGHILDISSAIKSLQIKPTIYPSTANYKTGIKWTSSNNDIAVVDENGFVTGISNGDVTITATTENGKTATWNVTVISTPLSIGLDKENVTLDISTNKTYQFKATIYPSTANYKTGITWTSSNNDVAVVDSNGFVTGISNGEVTITATTENGRAATWKVVVISTPLEISLDSENLVLDINGENTHQYATTIYPSTANASIGLRWEIESSSSPNVISISSNGVVTGLSNGTATVRVTTENNKTATCNVTVVTSPTGVTLDKSKATVDLSGTKTVDLTATLTPKTANIYDDLQWSSDSASAKVEKTGKYTARVTGVSNGNAKITVSTGNGYKAECIVTVETKIIGITVSPNETEVEVGNTVTLTATKKPSIGSTEGLVWSSSNNGVAKVNNDGVVTGIAQGTVTITIKSSSGLVKTKAKVTVVQSPTGITLDKNKVALDMSGTKTTKLNATIQPSNANRNTGITWNSSNTGVATVDQSGNVTAKANGTTTITATTQNGKRASCTVTVITSITSLSVSPTSKTLNIGETVQLTGTKNPSTTSEGTQWTSSNTSVATVSNSGLVTAKSAGTATITFKNSSSTKSASCTITVYSADLLVSTSESYLIKYNTNGNLVWDIQTPTRNANYSCASKKSTISISARK